MEDLESDDDGDGDDGHNAEDGTAPEEDLACGGNADENVDGCWGCCCGCCCWNAR